MLGTIDAYQLFHEGVIALARVEQNGICIDTDYVDKQMKITQKRADHVLKKLKKTSLGKKWKKTYRTDINPNESTKLSNILFNVMKVEPVAHTDKGAPKTDDKALRELSQQVPELLTWLEWKKLDKARNTFLKNIKEETVDGILHPFFHLNKAVSYRSSSSDPNFQNFPIRDPFIKKIIRRAFKPRPGRQLLEIDGKAMEVSFAYCYHQDKEMRKELTDLEKDMHRDMGMEIFKLTKKQMTGIIRYVAKNRFVFPAFYGSYFEQMAPELWKSIDELDMNLSDGTPMREHLASKGIEGYEDFKKHVQQVEDRFWGKRFKEYDQWKKDWYSDYLKNGWFITKTGFRIEGVMKRNEVINYPVQGSAFHALLWSLIELQKWLDENNMKTLIVGQIHDSMVLDVVPEELNAVMTQLHYIMTVKIRKVWTWINIPLTIEPEITPIDGSWYEKEEVSINDYLSEEYLCRVSQ